MPSYDFSCNQCGAEFTLSCRISAKDRQTCPQCGQAQLTQRFTTVNIGKSGCYRCDTNQAMGCGTEGCCACHA
ncbi:MAG: zinc ribbon domain-containing protein [Peptococcaceae bacterium]|jgi:putative FmdB family regulatory protein|nr:zinc ribbon domain-containing protein [Peptococcaceae bacterium]